MTHCFMKTSRFPWETRSCIVAMLNRSFWWLRVVLFLFLFFFFFFSFRNSYRPGWLVWPIQDADGTLTLEFCTRYEFPPPSPAISTVRIQLMMYGSKVILPRLHSYELLFFLSPYRWGGGVCCIQKFRKKKIQPVIYSRAPCIHVSYIRIFRKYSTCNYILFVVNAKYTVTAFGHLITLYSLVIKPRI